MTDTQISNLYTSFSLRERCFPPDILRLLDLLGSIEHRCQARLRMLSKGMVNTYLARTPIVTVFTRREANQAQEKYADD